MKNITIRVEVELQCTATVAWAAVHDPLIAAKIYEPIIYMRSRNQLLMPVKFESGSSTDIRLKFFNLINIGSQRIIIKDIVDRQDASFVKTMRDSGGPLSGPLILLKDWNHEMTIISVDGRGKNVGECEPARTVWKDQLKISGFFAPVFWLILKPAWHLRAKKIKKISLDWKE